METPDIIMSNPSIADVPPCVGGYLRAFHQANYSRDCCTQKELRLSPEGIYPSYKTPELLCS